MMDAAIRGIEPKSQFIQAMNDRMANVQDLEGTFTDSEWKLRYVQRGVDLWLSLDWSQFETELARREGTALVFQGRGVELTSTELAKFILLENRVSDKARSWQVCFNALHMIYCFLNSEGSDQVTKTNIDNFYGQALTMRPGALGWVKRAQCPGRAFFAWNMHDFASFLHRHKAKSAFVDVSVSKREDKRAFRTAVEEHTGLTLADYMEGGSLNFLGIDVGKHFVDHCGEWFRENYRYALAISVAYESTATQVTKNWGQTGASKKPITRYIATVLCGEVACNYQKETAPKVKAIALDKFIETFNHSGQLCTATSLPVIERVIECAGLPADRIDAEEFVRSFMVSLYGSDSPVTPEFVFTQYHHTIEEKTPAFRTTYAGFLATCEKVVKEHHFQLQNHDDALEYLAAQREAVLDWGKITKGHTSGQFQLRFTLPSDQPMDVRAMFDPVRCFGEVFCVALTGWRGSEYGFPFSSIKREPNEDLIDSAYTPIRYHVRWSPHKTHQGVQVDREITTDVFVVLSLLNELSKVSGGYGPLVRGTNRPTPKISAQRIADSIRRAWPHFATNYRRFIELDRQEVEGTLNKHLCSADTRELLEIRDNVRAHLLAYRLSNSSTFNSGLWIEAYRNNTLEPALRKAIEDILTDEVRALLESGQEELHVSDVAYISSQLLQNAKYPSPHALRHCWAEAVLRRYSGDVGKFIRANFKHLNARFFMAYLRDKDANTIYKMAKRETINSTVRLHLRAMLDENRAYGGHFDAFVSKTIGLLKVLPYKELRGLAQAQHEQADATLSELADKISSERIIEFKGNPWANCLLREHSQKAAKCSVKGEPQRHLAAPDRCMGCVNGDVQSAHFDYIVIYYADTLQALSDPDFPVDIKTQMLPSVIDLKKAIASLARNSGEDRHKQYFNALDKVIASVQREIAGVTA